MHTLHLHLRYNSYVLAREGNRVKLRYKGWGAKYEEWVELDPKRVRVWDAESPEHIEAERAVILKEMELYVVRTTLGADRCSHAI